MQTTIDQTQATFAKKRWPWQKGKDKAVHQQSVTVQQLAPAQPTNFYEQAIEWTHRADKVINLVLGYLLAIASVLGFMDVLSNGEVLNQVPYLFYVWLGIMGLGVDFQILLVVSRIPDVFRMPAKSWQKWIIFFFNLFFLLFLVVMSVMTGAIFTQHRDTINSTIGSSMGMLHIDSILYVYGRAALATLLLVLMAVDRTMERWRMQISVAQHTMQQVMPAQTAPAQPAALQVSDLDKVLQTVLVMNQQNLTQMQDMNRQTVEQVSQITVSLVEESMNRLTASISLPGAHVQAKQLPEHIQHDIEAMGPPEKLVYGKQNLPFEKDYKDQVETVLAQEPDLTDRDIAARVGCSVRTANKWRIRIQQPVQ